MGGRRWAVFIGSNNCGLSVRIPALKYAENDARAMYELLTDPHIGTFDADDTQLIVGSQATTPAVRAHLRSLALESSPSDVLLVYFAGHALVPDWGPQTDAYLGLADLDADALRENPDQALRMSFLRHDVFELFQGTSFLILDCCHAGAYVDNRRRHLPAIDAYGQQMDRHSALLSCPADSAARENDEHQHGVLTHQLLAALHGSAAGDDGRVSFTSMARYAVDHVTQPTPGHLLPMWGGSTTMLTLPQASHRDRQRPLTDPVNIGKIAACESPIERYAGSIQQLLARVFQSDSRVPRQAGPGGVGRLERIRAALDAQSAAMVEFAGPPVSAAPSIRPIDSTARFNMHDCQPTLEQFAQHVYPGAAPTTSFGYVGADSGGKQLLCVPLTHDHQRASALIIVDPAPAMLSMGELLSGVLHAIWSVDVADDAVHAEVRVLTALRTTFGRLPSRLYDHCLSLYEQLLQTLVMVFQPVIELGPHYRNVTVNSYEALARRGAGDRRAPIGILQIAHAWGDRFIVARDSILATKAIHAYNAADEAAGFERTLPVSINVAVRSLLSDAYVNVIRQAIHDARLNPHAVTLEISEQDPIRPAAGETWMQEPLTYFHNRLTALAGLLEVGFAVDDFGVGYSSLARMAELPLTHIKVDRAVLHHPSALQELELVMQVARSPRDRGQAPAVRGVTIEGFDDDSPVSLQQLFDLGIHCVQGFGVGPAAATTLHRLDDSDREYIARLIRGEHDQRAPGTSTGSDRRSRHSL